MVIAIHGGAGNLNPDRMPLERKELYLQALNDYCGRAYQMLNQDASAVEVATQVVSWMEDDPLFNCGRGSVINQEGKVEMDASIMDGTTRNAGAVAGAQHVRNAVQLAREIMEDGRAVMLIGTDADDFAESKFLPVESSNYFITERRLDQWVRTYMRKEVILDHEATSKFGTVGAVVQDRNGALAAATSTGGMMNKVPGRVGDSAVIGAGTFARNGSVAVSCTGQGEYFLRQLSAHKLHALMHYGKLDLQQASGVVMEDMMELGGAGGFVAIDAKGQIIMPFNTTAMFRAYVDASGNHYEAIF